MMKRQYYKTIPHQVPKIWGGERLARIFQIDDEENIGESWVVSRHKDGPSIVNGNGLDKLVTEEQLPYLVKYLDTSDNLSVQVHPGDEYARVHENSLGKTECWLILDAEPGAGIYLGLKSGVGKKDLSKALAEKGDLSSLLNFYPVKKYDFFFVPAGSIHAIGKGVFLAETQQSSGITYRVWDWNRVDVNGNSRELHLDKALDVIEFAPEKNQSEYFRKKNALDMKDGDYTLTDFKDFNLKLYKGVSSGELASSNGKRMQAILILEGTLELKGEEFITLKTHESLVFPPGSSLEFKCSENTKFLLIS